jgi:Leucine-rich repeat (LRR) protein
VLKIETLGTLTALRSLQLKLNSLVDISWLGNLGRLAWLNLAGLNPLTDLTALYGRENFYSLGLEGAHSLNVKALCTKNTNLIALDLTNCMMEDSFPDLSHLRELRRITLRNVRGLRDASSIKDVVGLSNITIEDCSDLQVYPPANALKAVTYFKVNPHIAPSTASIGSP